MRPAAPEKKKQIKIPKMDSRRCESCLRISEAAFCHTIIAQAVAPGIPGPLGVRNARDGSPRRASNSEFAPIVLLIIQKGTRQSGLGSQQGREDHWAVHLAKGSFRVRNSPLSRRRMLT